VGTGIAAGKLKRAEYLRIDQEQHAKLERRAGNSVTPDVRKTASGNERHMEPA
jgi:hypothetical protein